MEYFPGKKGKRSRIEGNACLSSKKPRFWNGTPSNTSCQMRKIKWRHRGWKKRGIEMKISSVPCISKIVYASAYAIKRREGNTKGLTIERELTLGLRYVCAQFSSSGNCALEARMRFNRED